MYLSFKNALRFKRIIFNFWSFQGVHIAIFMIFQFFNEKKKLKLDN